MELHNTDLQIILSWYRHFKETNEAHMEMDDRLAERLEKQLEEQRDK